MSVRAAYRLCSTVSGLELEFQRPLENCFSSIYAGISKEQDLVSTRKERIVSAAGQMDLPGRVRATTRGVVKT